MALLALSLVGCKGVDRLINGGDQDPQQPAPGVIGGYPLEEPTFNIPTPDGHTLRKWHGRLPAGELVAVDAVAGSTVRVFIRDAGFWFELRTSYSGAYYYSRPSLGEVQYLGTWAATKEYCIYQYIPDVQ